MSESLTTRLQFFDPTQSYSIRERKLPHWSQAGAICFITWRTWDSIPGSVLQSWLAERDAWLRRKGLNPKAPDFAARLRDLTPALQEELQRMLSDRWNDALDAGHGACVLRAPDLAAIVGESLRHFDGERYQLTDFVVMPNHVHVLAAFPDEDAMLKQCESWKHYSAKCINPILGRKGRLWQQDGFDHLVRSNPQFEHFRSYLAENPTKAGLRPGEYLHYSKVL